MNEKIPEGFDNLMNLLLKLARTKLMFGVEINFDGNKFRWHLKFSNIKADEIELKERK